MEGFCYYRAYVDPEFESLIERINPPRICIDNDASKDCTLVKVDSANKDGILLEMVQMLTDLDLVISKSYISSDGGWLMDVFHVKDKLGNKITDHALIHHIQQALCTKKRSSSPSSIEPKAECKNTTLEITMTDQPGLLSEVSAVLADLGCHVTRAMAWTHNHRAACIIYVDDHETGGPIVDQTRLSHIQGQLQAIVEARQSASDNHCTVMLTMTSPSTHTERRLHQLMLASITDYKYKTCGTCGGKQDRRANCTCTRVFIESWKERGYSVVNIQSKDRPKLLFDTLCALTDMQYMVFHAAISSNISIAAQEYYVRHRYGYTLDTETERDKLTQCLTAAVERRATQGLRFEIRAEDRMGLLSDVTRVFREYGLSVSMAEVGIKGGKAAGTFYVTDASCDHKISQESLEAVKREIGGSVEVLDDRARTNFTPSSSLISRSNNSKHGEVLNLVSLGSLLWSRLEWISNFGSTRQ